MSEATPRHDPGSSSFPPPLLHPSWSLIDAKVISEAACSCLQSIFMYTHSARLIPKLLDGMKTKAAGLSLSLLLAGLNSSSTGVKAKSLSCILIVLQKWAWSGEQPYEKWEDGEERGGGGSHHGADMEKQFDQLEDVLVSSLSDAQGDVRLEAR